MAGLAGAQGVRQASPALGLPAPAELAADASTVPDRVVDVAWDDWLEEHDSEPWSLLKRWNRPTTVDAAFPAHGLSRLALGDTTVSLDPAVLAATAARFDHPLGEQARDRLLALGVGEAVDLYCAASVGSPDMREFCVTHGLAPSDEVMRAVFFVRTAQQDQYEALDPDGALLALGYRSVPKKDRAALRAAMADLNGIDTLRVLAGQGSDEHHFVSLTEKERAYLVGQLTDRGDWARLWRLVPLMRAVDLFCATAVQADTPDAVAFCLTHHLAPADAAERAAFFLRTGQHEQYRALDPDGALLAAHYRDAPTEERSALREAMTRLGGIDVLRVLAGQRHRDGDVASLNHKERAYLTGQLTRRRDWDRLWPLTVLLPLADAVRVVHAFGDWRPSGEDDRRMFETLLAAGPVAKQVKALSTGSPVWGTPHTRIALRDLDERATDVVDLDFAPDGRGLAFASQGKCAGIVDLDSTTLFRLYHFTGSPTRIAQLGPDAVVVADSGRYRGRQRPARTRLHYYDSQGRQTLRFGTTRITHVRELRRTAGDRCFIVLAAQDSTEEGEWTLFTGEAGGPLVDTGMLSGRNHHPGLTATLDPEGRTVAVLDQRTALVADLADPTAAATLRGSTAAAGDSMPHAAMSPTLLVRGNDQGRVQVWRDPLTSGKAPVSKRLWQQQEDRRLIGLAWSPALQRLLALSRRGQDIAVHLPRLKALGTPAYDEWPVPGTRVPKPIPLGSAVPGARPFMRLSPGGDVLAMGGVLPGHIDLYALSLLTVRPFIGKPMGLMRPRDLTAVVTVLENPVLDEESRTTLTLLRTCLEHRFRHDVWLGDTHGAAVAGAYDIELGG